MPSWTGLCLLDIIGVYAHHWLSNWTHTYKNKYSHLGLGSIGTCCIKFDYNSNHLRTSNAAQRQTVSRTEHDGEFKFKPLKHVVHSERFHFHAVDSHLQSDHYADDHWQISANTSTDDSIEFKTCWSDILNGIL